MPGIAELRKRHARSRLSVGSGSVSLGESTLDTRSVVVGFALLLLAAAICALAGLSPDLPAALALLAVAAARPLPGLVYAMIVFVAPLGLWVVGLQDYVSQVFGGRDYVLSLSSAVVVFALFAAAVVRHRAVPRRRLAAVALAGLALSVWAVIGFADHGVAQTLVGVRLLLLPLATLAVIASLETRDVRRLIGVLSWLLVANALAAIGELIVGPARLVAWGFESDRAIRYIDGTFRAPGLAEVNAELGMLAGAYLLGYVALWLTKGTRPSRVSWHAGAVASVICLALSTSRSGGLMLAGGVLGAVVLDRSGGRARRRRSQLVGLLVVVGVAVAFVVFGATGSRSLVQRLDVWSSLLRSGAPLYGLGIGGVGGATFSRVANGPHVFVDNYFVSVALQFGPLAMVALAAVIIFSLIRLRRRSAENPTYVLHIAVLVGLTCSFLVIESWEYRAAMMCLALFVVHGLRLDPRTSRVEARVTDRPPCSSVTVHAPGKQPQPDRHAV
jgi:hypothetical protein